MLFLCEKRKHSSSLKSHLPFSVRHIHPSSSHPRLVFHTKLKRNESKNTFQGEKKASDKVLFFPSVGDSSISEDGLKELQL